MKIPFNTEIDGEIVNVMACIEFLPHTYRITFKFNDETLKVVETENADFDVSLPAKRDQLRALFQSQSEIN